jgi:hypothetical protein
MNKKIEKKGGKPIENKEISPKNNLPKLLKIGKIIE